MYFFVILVSPKLLQLIDSDRIAPNAHPLVDRKLVQLLKNDWIETPQIFKPMESYINVGGFTQYILIRGSKILNGPNYSYVL